MAEQPGELADGVRSVLAELGADAVVRLEPIPGGASRETWLIEAGIAGDRAAPGREGEEAARRYVLRRDPAGAESLASQQQEAGLIRLARKAGVPAPEPLHYEPAGGRFETAGILMAHVPGESVAPRLLRKPEYEVARGALTAQLGEALARLHSIELAAAVDVLGPPPADPVVTAIEVWEATLDSIGVPLPAVEAGLRWLRAERPDPAAPGLVHGDFRLGNFIVDESGLAAVIDWELAHIGDPVEDIGWLGIRSWRFGNDDRRVAGVGSLDDFLAAYAAAGGEPPDAERIRYWEVFGNLKWAVICARQANDHLSGLRRSHELASLGRRICEPEWDMLELIGTAR
ncbi:MAG: phosphotransferase family protein [Actinomycetota bacterium]